jgi:hypothetical protein
MNAQNDLIDYGGQVKDIVYLVLGGHAAEFVLEGNGDFRFRESLPFILRFRSLIVSRLPKPFSPRASSPFHPAGRSWSQACHLTMCDFGDQPSSKGVAPSPLRREPLTAPAPVRNVNLERTCPALISYGSSLKVRV